MRLLGAELLAACKRGGVILLSGDLGVGKTTLVRGALEAAGVRGGIRSPTYTLIELYPLERLTVAHFDLYRLGDPEELEYLGYRDYLEYDILCLVEWPERAAELLSRADLRIELAYDPQGRRVTFSATSAVGAEILRLMDISAETGS